MVSMIIWQSGLVLLAVILLRGFQAATLDKYPLFYLQVTIVLASFTVLYFRHEHPVGYARAYWFVQFLTMLVASGVIVEIIKHGLFPFPRSRRSARVILGVLFLAIACFVAGYILLSLSRFAGEDVLVDLERGFRTIQALFLLGIGGIVIYYRIPFSRNLKGMYIGYGIYVGTSLITLALRAYLGAHIDPTWYMVQPLSYDAGLMVWAVGLWSYSPPRIPRGNMGIATKSRLASIKWSTAPGDLSR